MLCAQKKIKLADDNNNDNNNNNNDNIDIFNRITPSV